MVQRACRLTSGLHGGATRLATIMAVWACGGAGLCAAAAGPAEIQLRATSTHVRVDGLLDEWPDRELTGRFVTAVGRPMPNSHQTRFAIRRTPTHLFLAFRCSQPQAELRLARVQVPFSDRMWASGDTLELFVRARDRTWHFGFMPTGTDFHLITKADGFQEGHPTGFQYAVKHTQHGWTGEVGIELDSAPFPLPKARARWGIRLGRRHAAHDLMSWWPQAPVQGHADQGWAWLIFVGPNPDRTSGQSDHDPAVWIAWSDTLDGHGAGKPVFRRASNATFWDADRGVLREVGANQARFEYQPGKLWGQPVGVLLEQQATNLFTHSSFETGMGVWQAGAGLDLKVVPGPAAHGARALRINASRRGGRIWHPPIDLPVQRARPFHNRFCVSFYVRRVDGGPIGRTEVRPVAAREPNGPNEITAHYGDIRYEALGRGPWHRVSGRFGPNGRRLEHTRWVCGLEAGSGQDLLVDALQLEQGVHANYTAGATSYVPTGAKPAIRQADRLHYPFGKQLQRPAGTLALWVRPNDPPSPSGHYVEVQVPSGAPYFCVHWQGATVGGAGIGFLRSKFPPPARWTFYTLTWGPTPAGPVAVLYRNGRAGLNRREGPVAMTRPVRLRDRVRISQGPAYCANALVADLMFWPRTLDPKAVRGLFLHGPAGLGRGTSKVRTQP